MYRWAKRILVMSAFKDEQGDDLTPVTVRLSPDELGALDAFIDRHGLDITRAQAIQRLIRTSLAIGNDAGPVGRMVDEGLHPEELTSQNDD